MSSKYTLQSVERALKILDLFYDRRELGPNEVAELMDITRSTAFRMLTTLNESEYLSKTANGRYRLGMKLFSLGQLAYSHTELISYAKPQLIKLAETFSETTNLSILDGYSVIFLDKVTPLTPLKMDTEIGHRYPLNATASGKSIMAFQAQSKISDFINSFNFVKLTDCSITDPEEFRRELLAVKENGYSTDLEECVPGLTCYAAPIMGHLGFAIAAISISGASTRMDVKKEDIIREVKHAAMGISKII